MPTFIYVAVAGDDKILNFSMEPESGELRLNEEVHVPGGPAPLAIDPKKQFLFAGLRASYQIASFRIVPKTGKLSLQGTIPLDTDPCFLSTDRSSHFLFSTYYSAGFIAVHAIGWNGKLNPEPVEWLSTDENPHALHTDPSNTFAFIPHTGGNVIFQCLFDENTGHLTPNSIPTVRPEPGLGPRHFCFHPTKNVLYVSNELGNSVTAYHFESTTGCLSEFQTISTLPKDYHEENTCAQIHIAPSGRFLYVSNRGHDSIACFSIDAASGQLRLSGHTLTEKIPRAFTFDPAGRFLFVAGRDAGRLASYRIHPQSGALLPIEKYPLGKRPLWLLAVSW